MVAALGVVSLDVVVVTIDDQQPTVRPEPQCHRPDEQTGIRVLAGRADTRPGAGRVDEHVDETTARPVEPQDLTGPAAGDVEVAVGAERQAPGLAEPAGGG